MAITSFLGARVGQVNGLWSIFVGFSLLAYYEPVRVPFLWILRQAALFRHG
jgi:hypothetical protein